MHALLSQALFYHLASLHVIIINGVMQENLEGRRRLSFQFLERRPRLLGVKRLPQRLEHFAATEAGPLGVCG